MSIPCPCQEELRRGWWRVFSRRARRRSLSFSRLPRRRVGWTARVRSAPCARRWNRHLPLRLLSLADSLSFTLSLTRTHTHTHPVSFCLCLCLFLSLSHTHTRTHAVMLDRASALGAVREAVEQVSPPLSLSRTHSVSISLCLCVSLSLSHTLSVSISLRLCVSMSLSHTLTLSRAGPRECARRRARGVGTGALLSAFLL